MCNEDYSLKEIYMYGTTPPSSIGNNIFPYSSTNFVAAFLIYVPEESLSDYQSAMPVYTNKFRGI